jgi:hypothetical protein
VSAKCSIEGSLALRCNRLDAATEHVGRRKEGEAIVMMVIIVPAEEGL